MAGILNGSSSRFFCLRGLVAYYLPACAGFVFVNARQMRRLFLDGCLHTEVPSVQLFRRHPVFFKTVEQDLLAAASVAGAGNGHLPDADVIFRRCSSSVVVAAGFHFDSARGPREGPALFDDVFFTLCPVTLGWSACRARWLQRQRNRLAHAMNGNTCVAPTWQVDQSQWSAPVISPDFASASWTSVVGVALVSLEQWNACVAALEETVDHPGPLAIAISLGVLPAQAKRKFSTNPSISVEALRIISVEDDAGAKTIRCALLQLGASPVMPEAPLNDDSWVYSFKIARQWCTDADWNSWNALSQSALHGALARHPGLADGILESWSFWKDSGEGCLGGKVRMAREVCPRRNGCWGLVFRAIDTRPIGSFRPSVPVLWVTATTGATTAVDLMTKFGDEPSFGGITYGKQGLGVLIVGGPDHPSRSDWQGLLESSAYRVAHGGGSSFETSGWRTTVTEQGAIAWLHKRGWTSPVKVVRRRTLGGLGASRATVTVLVILADGPPPSWLLQAEAGADDPAESDEDDYAGIMISITRAAAPDRKRTAPPAPSADASKGEAETASWTRPRRGDDRPGSKRAARGSGGPATPSPGTDDWEAKFKALEQRLTKNQDSKFALLQQNLTNTVETTVQKAVKPAFDKIASLETTCVNYSAEARALMALLTGNIEARRDEGVTPAGPAAPSPSAGSLTQQWAAPTADACMEWTDGDATTI